MNPVASGNRDASALGAELASTGYVRTRRAPRRRDGDYLILSDVGRLVRRHASEFGGRIFDYGCGGAPYQDLFARCEAYVRADVLPGPCVDRLLGEDGMTAESSDAYDWVFSTQVLEHVPDPARYLAECRRILRPGGALLLTTHGFYPEHGCPYDFHRWTAEGLVRTVATAGLEVMASGKLTAGVRAAVQLMHHGVWNLRRDPPNGWLETALGALRKAYGWAAVPLLNWFADRFPEQSEMSATSSPTLYVGVYVRARKPVA